MASRLIASAPTATAPNASAPVAIAPMATAESDRALDRSGCRGAGVRAAFDVRIIAGRPNGYLSADRAISAPAARPNAITTKAPATACFETVSSQPGVSRFGMIP
jgi:hypothetical protein